MLDNMYKQLIIIILNKIQFATENDYLWKYGGTKCLELLTIKKNYISMQLIRTSEQISKKV